MQCGQCPASVTLFIHSLQNLREERVGRTSCHTLQAELSRRLTMGILELKTVAQAMLAALCLAMVGVTYGATFTEQFSTFSSDGYHVQVSPDGNEAKIVLDQYAGKYSIRFTHIVFQAPQSIL